MGSGAVRESAIVSRGYASAAQREEIKPMSLKNKVAIVTGGAGGMGRATALRFLDEGAKVVIADFNTATGEETLQLAAAAGHADAVRFVKVDVAREGDIISMIDSALDSFGHLDVIFNNAGVGGAIGPIWELEEAEWDYTFAVLVKGVFFGIKHAADRKSTRLNS